jgi:hypothetical protein
MMKTANTSAMGGCFLWLCNGGQRLPLHARLNISRAAWQLDLVRD